MKTNTVLQLNTNFTTPGFGRKVKAGTLVRVLGTRDAEAEVLVTTRLSSQPVWGSVFAVNACLLSEVQS